MCPDRINVFFDNVGGAQLHTALDHMAVHGRVVLCGQISACDEGGDPPPALDMMKVVYGRLRLEGFVTSDFLEKVDHARAELLRQLDAGQLTVQIDSRGWALSSCRPVSSRF